jgi:adenosine deaminase
LADGYGEPLPSGLQGDRWSFRDFDDFMDQYSAACRLLKSTSDFFRIAIEFVEDAAAAGARYVEATFTPGGHARRLGTWTAPLEAVLAGFEQASVANGLKVRVILDHSREQPLATAMRTAELALEFKDRGVVALGLGGDERYEPQLFEEAFKLATDGGLKAVVHAGEFTGPESIWGAIDVLGASRIGHGLAASQDLSLLKRLVKDRIPLEVCPTSNLRTRVVKELSAHPLPSLLDAGVGVTINTDNPTMFGTNLRREFQLVCDMWGRTHGQLHDAADLAVESACDVAAARAALAHPARDQSSAPIEPVSNEKEQIE